MWFLCSVSVRFTRPLHYAPCTEGEGVEHTLVLSVTWKSLASSTNQTQLLFFWLKKSLWLQWVGACMKQRASLRIGTYYFMRFWLLCFLRPEQIKLGTHGTLNSRRCLVNGFLMALLCDCEKSSLYHMSTLRVENICLISILRKIKPTKFKNRLFPLEKSIVPRKSNTESKTI